MAFDSLYVPAELFPRPRDWRSPSFFQHLYKLRVSTPKAISSARASLCIAGLGVPFLPRIRIVGQLRTFFQMRVCAIEFHLKGRPFSSRAFALRPFQRKDPCSFRHDPGRHTMPLSDPAAFSPSFCTTSPLCACGPFPTRNPFFEMKSRGMYRTSSIFW